MTDKTKTERIARLEQLLRFHGIDPDPEEISITGGFMPMGLTQQLEYAHAERKRADKVIIELTTATGRHPRIADDTRVYLQNLCYNGRLISQAAKRFKLTWPDYDSDYGEDDY